MSIEINIHKQFNRGKRGFSLHGCFASSDETIVLFGPSGSGKSLTLKAIAGLVTPDKGRIAINGEVLFDSNNHINRRARDRKVGLVFQNYALFPHLTVSENVGFGLKQLFFRLSGKNRTRISELLALFDLEEVADLYPDQISGGQQQRVALARTIAHEPRLLLLDEPLAALDQPLKISMRKELRRILKQLSIPTILVTHDPVEVDYFAQTVVVYNKGCVDRLYTTFDSDFYGKPLSEIVSNRVASICHGHPGTPGDLSLECGALHGG